MEYYLVAVASMRYHGAEPLTYSSEQPLVKGAIVSVPLQRQTSLGVVLRKVPKPSFATRPIENSHPDITPLPRVLQQLLVWMTNYYPAPISQITQLFLPKNLPTHTRAIKKANIFTLDDVERTLPDLTKEQEEAIKVMASPGSYLVHGETGSGKTRLYMELAKRTLEQGKSCIILTPEISLTTQLAKSFTAVIRPDRLHVMHSNLTDAARRAIWLALNTTDEPVVVIGARSALFSPVASVGLVVLDEFHEPAYKQESGPYYHAARVAATLAAAHNALLVSGSATPPVVEYYYAQQKNRPIIRLEKQAIQKSDTHTTKSMVVDLRDKTQRSSHAGLSNTLITQIEKTLQSKQQTILFLNRRGTARIVLCNSCSWQASCPHCDLPLTYHQDSHNLRCHTCDFKRTAYTSCPDCGNTDIIMKSAGTKAVETAVTKRFPTARVARFDADNLTGERIHEVYEDIRSGAVDILIGTQTLAKGLDLPKLGLVGILNADASLYIPDYSAQERTYQLIYQLLGRVGRGHGSGTVVIQTYSPDNATIQAAIHKDWNSFYTAELLERKNFLFPPFCHLLKATCRRSYNKSAQANAEKVADLLHRQHPGVVIEGPAPAFHEKVQNKFVWQIICKSKNRQQLLDVVKSLPADWTYDLDPIDLL